MKDIIFVLDRAHGKDVPGKSSKDGKFQEWKSSEAIIQKLIKGLDKLRIPYENIVTGEIEPGLEERVIRANEAVKGCKYPVFISLHHNGHDTISTARGSEIYVNRSATKESKAIANIVAKNLKKDFPEMPWRTEWPNRLEREANFTVIAGTKKVKPSYHGVLLEFGFMTNEKDLELLRTPAVIKRYVDSLLYSITEICTHFKVGDFKPEVNIKSKSK